MILIFHANVLIGIGKLNTWKPPYISESLNQEESVAMNQSLGFISVFLQLLAHAINPSTLEIEADGSLCSHCLPSLPSKF